MNDWRTWHDDLDHAQASWILDIRRGDSPGYVFNIFLSVLHPGKYQIKAMRVAK